MESSDEKTHHNSMYLSLPFNTDQKGILRHSDHHSPPKRKTLTINRVINLSKSPIKKHHHHHSQKENALQLTNDTFEDQDDPSCKPTHYISSPLFHSFKEYSYQEEKNEQYRQTMEDCGRVYDHFMDDPYKSYFSLFDGHGGAEVAKYACDHLHKIFGKYLSEHRTKVEKALKKSFLVLDEELKKFKNTDSIGSTATVIFINRETDAMLGTKKVVYCANIGDTSCVLFSKSRCKKLSFDHRCNEESEVTRVKKGGGLIANGRLNGKLEVTRGFGDFAMKSKGLTCEPFINKIVLNESDKFVVLCTDGVWDVVNEEDLFYLTINVEDTEQIARDILNHAMKNGSKDNMSCIVIKL